MAESKSKKPLHRYRSHTCGALRAADIGSNARLSGWVHRVRDHGGVLFIDLRDHYGITQVVADPDSAAFKMAEKVRSEWVIRVDGKVRARPEGTTNAELPTGEIEMYATEIEVLSEARSCRSRCSASPSIRRTCALPTAFSTCAVRPCTASS
jgi:aspartyl-tRNA synthetase